jgi:hypothetical protein
LNNRTELLSLFVDYSFSAPPSQPMLEDVWTTAAYRPDEKPMMPKQRIADYTRKNQINDKSPLS